MADFGAPVAAGVQGPQAGLQTIAGLLGLKQRQLALTQQALGIQQQEQQLKSQTAQATATAIHTQNLQGLQSVDWRQFDTPDGYDMQSAQVAAQKVGGADAPDFISRLGAMTQNATAAKQGLYKLNQQYQQPIRAAFGTWGANPNASVADLASQLDQIEETAPKEAQGQIRSIINNSLKVLTGPDVLTGTPRPVQQQKGLAVSFARAGLTESEVGGPGGLATPSTGTVGTGGAVVPIAQSRVTGAVTPEPGAMPTTLPPQVITQPGTGAPAAIGGAAGTRPQPIGGGQGQAQGANWWNPAPGQVQLLHANTAALAARLQAGNVAANAAPQAIDALERSRSILDSGTWTGGTFSATKDLRNLLAGIGVDTQTAQNASELAKNLARYEAARAGSVGSTDAARSLYEAGAPNTKMDAAAVKAVVLQSLGIEKMIQGYARAVGGQQSPQAAMQAEQQFRSIPHIVQAYELGFMRNKQEADEFMKRYGVSGRDLAKSAQMLKQLGAL